MTRMTTPTAAALALAVPKADNLLLALPADQLLLCLRDTLERLHSGPLSRAVREDYTRTGLLMVNELCRRFGLDDQAA